MELKNVKYPRSELRKSADIIEILDPLVKEWFFNKFKEFVGGLNWND